MLFDLKKDPDELVNLAGRPEHLGVEKRRARIRREQVAAHAGSQW
jgi:hypothetical protein